MTFDPFAPQPRPADAVTWGTREYDQTPEAREFARGLVAGTTTSSDDVVVVWLGAHLALVKRKGAKQWVCRGRQGYYPTRYEAVDRHRCATFGLHVPDVFTGEALLPPAVHGRAVKDLPAGVNVMRSVASVPASDVGKCAKATRNYLGGWIEQVLAKVDEGYMVLAEQARVRERERQEAEAAANRTAHAEAVRQAKLHHAAPRMAAALRDLAGFTARVAQGAAVTRQEAEAAGRVILAALSEAGISAKVGESVIERLNEVSPS